jgi:hypothetical protein
MRLNRYDWPDMQTTASPGEAGPGRTLWATLLLLVLVACQVRWALGWFGPDLPTAWQQLVSDEPIYTARHPLHLYHAQLGAAALRVWGTSACYDPAFQAGYPKTLFFDEGCRPAELLLAAVRHAAAGPRIAPALVYKGWLLGACVAVPLLLALAAWGLGARWLGWLTAAGLGCALTWTQPVSGLLECGDADVVVGGAALATHAGLLVRFVRLPGVRVWLGLALTATLGWASWPIVWAAATPLVLAAYLALARRLTLAQHLALGTLPILLGFCHAESLEQLTAHWWICLPVGQVNLPLPSEPTPTPWPQWLAVVWGLGGLGLLGRLAAGERLTPYLLGRLADAVARCMVAPSPGLHHRRAGPGPGRGPGRLAVRCPGGAGHGGGGRLAGPPPAARSGRAGARRADPAGRLAGPAPATLARSDPSAHAHATANRATP